MICFLLTGKDSAFCLGVRALRVCKINVCSKINVISYLIAVDLLRIQECLAERIASVCEFRIPLLLSLNIIIKEGS